MKNSIIKYFALLTVCFSCSDNLPYNLEKYNQDGNISISDSQGVPILEENYKIGFDDKNPLLKSMKKYSTNKFGLVVYVETIDKKYYYISIKPKPKEEQVYAELQVNYKIFTEQEYKKLDLQDHWHKIR